MAIIKQRGLQVTVATINERNALPQKPEHLVVHVTDAIADELAGSGPAVYRWVLDINQNGTWVLVSAGAEKTVSFTTQEISIINGQVTADNVPLNNHIWNLSIVDGDNIIAFPRIEDLDISIGIISGLDTWNSYKFRFTYAYGSITAQLQAVLDTKSTLYESDEDPLDEVGNKVKAGDMWHDLNSEGRIAICLTLGGTLNWLEI